MKRHKVPFLLVVVIITAVTVTTVQQLRSVAAIQSKAVQTRSDEARALAESKIESSTESQKANTAAARAAMAKLKTNDKQQRDDSQNHSVITLAKSDSTY
jgi:cell division protein FtsL